MARVGLNVKKINPVITKSFRATALLLSREFTMVISDPGAFPEFPGQDIVDTGALRRSQQVSFPSPTTALYQWPVDYALYVHEGYTRQNGTIVPARRWTQVGLARFDFQATINKIVKSKLEAEK